MTTRIIFLILFTGIFIRAFAQPSLIGTWRCIDNPTGRADTTDKRLKAYDLQIPADSTFHIEGDTATAFSTSPGWHTGDECNGSWQLKDNARLVLWMDEKKKMFVAFRIIDLTQKKLVLQSVFDLIEKRNYITYIRL